jgi:hypothetical protein
LGQFSKNYRPFYQKSCQKALKIWSWDPGSEIRDPEKNLFRIADLGVKKAPDPGSATLAFLFFFHRLSNEIFKIHLPQLSNTKKKERALIDNEYIL